MEGCKSVIVTFAELLSFYFKTKCSENNKYAYSKIDYHVIIGKVVFAGK